MYYELDLNNLNKSGVIIGENAPTCQLAKQRHKAT